MSKNIHNLVSRQEELPIEEGEGMGGGRAEGSSAVGGGGQAAISLEPDVDGTGSGVLLGWILSVAAGR